MGQFLTISLAKEFSIPKEEPIKYEVSITSISDKLKQDWRIDTELYHLEEDADYCNFSLKPDLLEAELYDFLTTFYPQYYKEHRNVYHLTLNELKESKSVSDFINNYSEEQFQIDKYAGPLLLHFKKIAFRSYVKVYLNECIIIAMAGKIWMEAYNNMFQFMSNTIQAKFSEYKISSSLLVNITG